jgi:hypothetical protein
VTISQECRTGDAALPSIADAVKMFPAESTWPYLAVARELLG